MKWSNAVKEILPKLDIRVENPAVVFDIDGTLISINGRRIEEVYNLYLYCKQKGYSIFIITARPDIVSIRKLTEIQLQNCNISYKQLFMKPALFLDNGFFKSEIRRSIEKSGYKIILNVGDLNSDHVGYPSMLNCKGI